MSDYSTYLFAVPSFAEGAGRLFDLGDTLTQYNQAPDAQMADAWAFWFDFAAVGEDLRGAFFQYMADHQEKQPA
ncbi:MAG TPA: hypothetical protein VG318_00950 [Actinomycetota bacterium]|nr:hypothetical protein [Actinomycetota bacterium]